MVENINHIERQDRAVEVPEADTLERGPFVAGLVKTLVHTEYCAGTGAFTSMVVSIALEPLA
jgi:hypothetical protein